MAKKKTEKKEAPIFDVGGFAVPDFDPAVFDFVATEQAAATEETRYIKPKIFQPVSEDGVCYENARDLARDIKLDFGERTDVFVSGNFIFGDFLEAYLVEHHVKCRKLLISTLSLNQNNTDSLAALLRHGYIDRLDLIVSAYFYGMERHSLVPYIYRKLDVDDRFQLAVAGVHTKTAQFETAGGRKIVMHGSANLRSSGNIEQFTIEENPVIYDFYDEHLSRIVDTYKTINKPVRHDELWTEFIKKQFND